MATKVWKYELEITERQTLMIPGLEHFLGVQMQYGRPVLWALVTPDGVSDMGEQIANDPQEYVIRMFGTGQDMDQDFVDTTHFKNAYLGTVQAGGFVWHFYVEGW